MITQPVTTVLDSLIALLKGGPAPALGREAAIEVVSLIEEGGTSVPVAQAFELLGHLPWPSRWEALVELRSRGPTLDGMNYLEILHHASVTHPNLDARVLAAVIAELLLMGGRTFGPGDVPAAERLALTLLSLEGTDQLEVFSRLGVTSVEVEGTIALMEAAAVADGLIAAPVQAVVGSTAGGLLNGVPFGDWPDSNQHRNFIVGNGAHRAIAAWYRDRHPYPIHRVFTNDIPTATIIRELAAVEDFAPEALEERLSRGRPDIFDFSIEGHFMPPGWVYEIKPYRLAHAASIETFSYAEALNKAGVQTQLGPMGASGTKGVTAAPYGWFVFDTPAPGVIAYEYRPAPPLAIKAREESRGRQPAPIKYAEALKALGAAAATIVIAALVIGALGAGGWVVLLAAAAAT